MIVSRCACRDLVIGSQYIVILNNQITVLDRKNFLPVCKFNGIRYIHGAVFVNDDVIAVHTGEQRLIFLHISTGKVIWEVPNIPQIQSSGDMRCCLIPGSERVACVARGKKSLEEHYLLVADYQQQTVLLEKIPNCYRVVATLQHTCIFGLSLLTYQSDGYGSLSYRIIGIDDSGSFAICQEGVTDKNIESLFGEALFLSDYKGTTPIQWVCKLTYIHKDIDKNASQISMPYFEYPGIRWFPKKYLPRITWVGRESKLLVACAPEWVGILNFEENRLVFEYKGQDIHCAAIINEGILIGTARGVLLLTLE